jgi:hypothetical protein
MRVEHAGRSPVKVVKSLFFIRSAHARQIQQEEKRGSKGKRQLVDREKVYVIRGKNCGQQRAGTHVCFMIHR